MGIHSDWLGLRVGGHLALNLMHIPGAIQIYGYFTYFYYVLSVNGVYTCSESDSEHCLCYGFILTASRGGSEPRPPHFLSRSPLILATTLTLVKHEVSAFHMQRMMHVAVFMNY